MLCHFYTCIDAGLTTIPSQVVSVCVCGLRVRRFGVQSLDALSSAELSSGSRAGRFSAPSFLMSLTISTRWARYVAWSSCAISHVSKSSSFLKMITQRCRSPWTSTTGWPLDCFPSRSRARFVCRVGAARGSQRCVESLKTGASGASRSRRSPSSMDGASAAVYLFVPVSSLILCA